MSTAEYVAKIKADILGKRERKIEMLARDICWAEFTIKPKEATKAAYWRSIHPERRAEYIEDARWLVWIVKKLKPLRILALVDYHAAKPAGGRKDEEE